MSLTRAQWQEMFDRMKVLEAHIRLGVPDRHRQTQMKAHTAWVKRRIESVIGQQE